jgi:hypothetical protein
VALGDVEVVDVVVEVVAMDAVVIEAPIAREQTAE